MGWGTSNISLHLIRMLIIHFILESSRWEKNLSVILSLKFLESSWPGLAMKRGISTRFWFKCLTYPSWNLLVMLWFVDTFLPFLQVLQCWSASIYGISVKERKFSEFSITYRRYLDNVLYMYFIRPIQTARNKFFAQKEVKYAS